MSIDVEHSAAPAAPQQQQQDFIRGARAIGQAVGIDKRAAHHLIATGALKSVRKVGGRFWASRSRLLREVGSEP
jgi:hypothetical protein